MTAKDVGIYASLYCEHLDDVQSVLASVVPTQGFRRIEQGTVLLYEDGTLELSVEWYHQSFYMSGRCKAEISEATRLLERMATAFEVRGIAVSIDYGEEDERGKMVSPCLLIATRGGPHPS